MDGQITNVANEYRSIIGECGGSFECLYGELRRVHLLSKTNRLLYNLQFVIGNEIGNKLTETLSDFRSKNKEKAVENLQDLASSVFSLEKSSEVGKIKIGAFTVDFVDQIPYEFAKMMHDACVFISEKFDDVGIGDLVKKSVKSIRVEKFNDSIDGNESGGTVHINYFAPTDTWKLINTLVHEIGHAIHKNRILNDASVSCWNGYFSKEQKHVYNRKLLYNIINQVIRDFSGDNLYELLTETISVGDDFDTVEFTNVKQFIWFVRQFEKNFNVTLLKYNDGFEPTELLENLIGELEGELNEIGECNDWTNCGEMFDENKMLYKFFTLPLTEKISDQIAINDDFTQFDSPPDCEEYEFPSWYASYDTYEDFAETFKYFILNRNKLSKSAYERMRKTLGLSGIKTSSIVQYYMV